MIVKVQDLEVLFPYDYMYPEQFDYMLQLKKTLDGRGHCLLEMPTGTGKTVTLLSFILSYQYAHEDTGKLVYCTRTVQEMDKVVEELRLIMEYREKILSERSSASASEAAMEIENGVAKQIDSGSISTPIGMVSTRKTLGICLSSRRNMCIHPAVSKFDNREKVDALCRNLTASFVREQKEEKGGEGVSVCEFYEGYKLNGSDATLTGVHSLDNLKEVGKEKKWCPYFMARHLINLANVVVYNYQYMLDPRISGMVSREIEKESIIVFDEAHNIDNVCIEALSVLLDRKTILASSQNVNKLAREIQQAEATDSRRLNEEYQNLVRGLARNGMLDASSSSSSSSSSAPLGGGGGGGGGRSLSTALGGGGNNAASVNGDIADQLLASPVMDPSLLEEALPGNIRRAKHFIGFMRKIVEFLKQIIQGQVVTQENPAQFLRKFQEATRLPDTRAMKFCYERLSSLLRALCVVDIDEYTPLSLVASFATLVGMYDQGFTLIFEPCDDRTPHISDPVLHLACLDASLAIKPVFDRFRNVVITSGTLSPLDVYPKILNFNPRVSESLNMSLSRNCICPVVVSKGSDQLPVTTKWEMRQDKAVVQNYGKLLIELAAVIPDGMICFFTR